MDSGNNPLGCDRLRYFDAAYLPLISKNKPSHEVLNEPRFARWALKPAAPSFGLYFRRGRFGAGSVLGCSVSLL